MKTYTLRVALDIQDNYFHILNTSSLASHSAGILSEQYLALTIGWADTDMGTKILRYCDAIQDTKSAIVLEELVG